MALTFELCESTAQASFLRTILVQSTQGPTGLAGCCFSAVRARRDFFGFFLASISQTLFDRKRHKLANLTWEAV